MFVGPSLLPILLFTLFWAMGFDKNPISVEMNPSIRVFIPLFVKQGEWPQTLPAFDKSWLDYWTKKHLQRCLEIFPRKYTLDTFIIVTPPGKLLKLSTFSNTYNHSLSLKCKLGEFITYSIRDLGLTEFVIALLLLQTFHFMSVATDSVPTSFIINIYITII